MVAYYASPQERWKHFRKLNAPYLRAEVFAEGEVLTRAPDEGRRLTLRLHTY